MRNVNEKTNNEVAKHVVAEMVNRFEPESAIDCIVRDNLAGGTESEDIFLQVDWRDGEIYVVTRGHHERGSCSSDVWNNLVGEYVVCNMADAYSLAYWIDKNMKMLGRVRACFEESWNGNNWVGGFDFDVDPEAGDFFEELTDGIFDVDVAEADIITADEYFADSFRVGHRRLHTTLGDTPAYTLDDLGDDPVSALTSLMGDVLDDRGCDSAGCIVVDTRDYASELVDELIDANDD
ncbi:hypothetical protein GM415_15475 [Pseudodesulfovibrio cashew]|uniref:Uncharacterized protein n=1 Tax=Pseudodesulfovibrio cashew TaxID=2678688 RepID=A0A6I6JF35_9BACT|nr:hypothetical protein [Pseudodesulfovibrio cashew]QGY41456.1 hypothetical protein GM415_15475 [Pseudodesulfovibrio cashew]